MNVFVTGGSGLIGSHVIQLLLSNGHSVRALVRDESGKRLVESFGATAVHGSVEDPQAWTHARQSDAIVHAAALVTQQASWGTFHAVNVEGTRHAASSAGKQGIRLVHISSVAVYGRRPGDLAGPVDEDSPRGQLADTDYYARSKRMAEEVLWTASEKTRIRAVAIRPCVVYGERDRAFMPRVLRALRFGIAPLVGNGKNVLTVVYAGNVAEAVQAALEHPEVEGPFNTTNDGELTQREFVATVAAAMGRRVRFVRVPFLAAQGLALSYHWLQRLLRPGKYPTMGAAAARFLATENPFTSERARRRLKWNPSVPPADAIRRSVRWFSGDE
jgi:nucleoside-diphosphate-sugar epimerase